MWYFETMPAWYMVIGFATAAVCLILAVISGYFALDDNDAEAARFSLVSIALIPVSFFVWPLTVAVVVTIFVYSLSKVAVKSK